MEAFLDRARRVFQQVLNAVGRCTPDAVSYRTILVQPDSGCARIVLPP